MPFIEPRVNTFQVTPPAGSFPEVCVRDAAEVKKLSKLWDANGLLCLIPVSLGPSSSEKFLYTRVFGNFRNSNADRQIGDTRGRNFTEGRMCEGPSHEIPNATSIFQP